MKRPRTFAGASFLTAVLVACGGSPTAPPDPEPPGVVVDWEGLRRLYDDPLYRRLAHLLEDESVANTLQAEMSALVLEIQNEDLAGLKQALAQIHETRVTYAARAGSDRHQEPQLLALALFEIRGAAFIGQEPLQRRDALLTMRTEDEHQRPDPDLRRPRRSVRHAR